MLEFCVVVVVVPVVVVVFVFLVLDVAVVVVPVVDVGDDRDWYAGRTLSRGDEIIFRSLWLGDSMELVSTFLAYLYMST